ncbi:hypothetical protein [Paraburkholderia steynii]|uniref:hypothetical protein n=1 Tax=Paraburkholderia steynii TaxID=1245441 RepID=UPI001ABE3ABF|nr:hypothetical protein [Paraburkholderia steynii]
MESEDDVVALPVRDTHTPEFTEWARRLGHASLEELVLLPTISRLAANAMALDAFAQAEPSRQPDAES